VLDFALRGFAPKHIKHRFKHRLARYEMQNLPQDTSSIGIELISGSFMFCRTAPLQKIGGFSDAYFVYFEDFDLSLRAAHLGDLAYVPKVKITHLGGNAARKGWRHILLFVQGAFLFYQRNGWKWQ
jgi:GT2 family glycosyltransferase